MVIFSLYYHLKVFSGRYTEKKVCKRATFHAAQRGTLEAVVQGPPHARQSRPVSCALWMRNTCKGGFPCRVGTDWNVELRAPLPEGMKASQLWDHDWEAAGYHQGVGVQGPLP